MCAVVGKQDWGEGGREVHIFVGSEFPHCLSGRARTPTGSDRPRGGKDRSHREVFIAIKTT